jgi:hypothetical protein
LIQPAERHVSAVALDGQGGHNRGMSDDAPEYTDITCTTCGRHNRTAHMVGLSEDLRLCSVCVGKVGAMMDSEAGVVGPALDWAARWPLKRVE